MIQAAGAISAFVTVLVLQKAMLHAVTPGDDLELCITLREKKLQHVKALPNCSTLVSQLTWQDHSLCQKIEHCKLCCFSYIVPQKSHEISAVWEPTQLSAKGLLVPLQVHLAGGELLSVTPRPTSGSSGML
jgi:hypothetical protein